VGKTWETLLVGGGRDIGSQEGTMNASFDFINTIIVSGTGRVTRPPDEATIQVSVENDEATAAEALDANSKDTRRVLDRLKAEGIADNAIETANKPSFIPIATMTNSQARRRPRGIGRSIRSPSPSLTSRASVMCTRL
jgi:hypothetical protein